MSGSVMRAPVLRSLGPPSPPGRTARPRGAGGPSPRCGRRPSLDKWSRVLVGGASGAGMSRLPVPADRDTRSRCAAPSAGFGVGPPVAGTDGRRASRTLWTSSCVGASTGPVDDDHFLWTDGARCCGLWCRLVVLEFFRCCRPSLHGRRSRSRARDRAAPSWTASDLAAPCVASVRACAHLGREVRAR